MSLERFKRIRKLALSFILVFAAACQTTGATEDAVLASSDSDTIAVLQSTLAAAMNVASVQLGPEDPTQTSMISVLPPRPGPQEDRSLAQPTQFRIILKNGRCHVMRVDTGAMYELVGIRCLSANTANSR